MKVMFFCKAEHKGHVVSAVEKKCSREDEYNCVKRVIVKVVGYRTKEI